MRAIYLIVCLGLLFSELSFGGGVVGRGGGDIPPEESISPNDIVSMLDPAVGEKNGLYKNVAIDIVGWVYSLERLIWNTPSSSRKPWQSALVLKTSELEGLLNVVMIQLNMNSPCMDKDGVARDGVALSMSPPRICLSPFSMSKKLNRYNFQFETKALLVHELSHLLGFTEDECIEIQLMARRAFSTTNDSILDVITKYKQYDCCYFENDLGLMRLELEQVSKNHSLLTSQKMNQWLKTNIIKIENKLLGEGEKWRFTMASVPWILLDQFMKEKVRHEILYMYLCSVDQKNEPSLRDQCRSQLNKGFGNDSKITTETWRYRIGQSHFDENNVYPSSIRTVVSLPKSESDVFRELYLSKNTFDKLQVKINSIGNIKFNFFQQEP